jgi:hypothetical protein
MQWTPVKSKCINKWEKKLVPDTGKPGSQNKPTASHSSKRESLCDAFKFN